MWVKCNECGNTTEINGKHYSPYTRCGKCGMGILERTEAPEIPKQQLKTIHSLFVPPAPAQARVIKPPEKLETPAARVTIVDSVKTEEEVETMAGKPRSAKKGWEKVADYAKAGKEVEEIIALMKGELSETSVRNYYAYAKRGVRPPSSRKKPAAAAPVAETKKARKKPGPKPKNMRRPPRADVDDSTPDDDKTLPFFRIYQQDLDRLSDEEFDKVWTAIGIIVRTRS